MTRQTVLSSPYYANILLKLHITYILITFVSLKINKSETPDFFDSRQPGLHYFIRPQPGRFTFIQKPLQRKCPQRLSGSDTSIFQRRKRNRGETEPQLVSSSAVCFFIPVRHIFRKDISDGLSRHRRRIQQLLRQ